MKYAFQIIDVFSSTPFGGNQLAVLPDAVGISTEGMQKIAREFNFGGTTFVLPKNDPADTCRGHIFTPRVGRFAASRPPNRRCRVLDYRRKTRCLPNARMAHSRTDDAARCVLGECWRSDRVPAFGREYLCSRPAV